MIEVGKIIRKKQWPAIHRILIIKITKKKVKVYCVIIPANKDLFMLSNRPD